MKTTRTRQHQTPIARRMRRLGLDLPDLQRLTRAAYGTCKNWKQGRSAPPRAVLRLLAAYRLLHWGNY